MGISFLFTAGLTPLKMPQHTLCSICKTDGVLQVYDGPYTEKYTIEPHQVVEGIPCAAPYTYEDGSCDWHRAVVLSLGPNPESCEVVTLFCLCWNKFIGGL